MKSKDTKKSSSEAPVYPGLRANRINRPKDSDQEKQEKQARKQREEIESKKIDAKLESVTATREYEANIIIWIAVGISFAFMASLFFPYLQPIVLATIFGLAIIKAKALFSKLSKGRKWLVGSGIGAALVFLIYAVGLAFGELSKGAANLTSGESRSLFIAQRRLSEFLARQIISVNGFIESFGIDYSINADSLVSSYFKPIMNSAFVYAAGVLANLPNLVIGIFVFGVFFYFVLKNRIAVFAKFLHMLPHHEMTYFRILGAALNSAYVAVISNLVNGFIQASILTLGCALGGLTRWPLIFVGTAVSAMFPLLGILPMSLLCIVLANEMNGPKQAFIVLGFALMASIADNLIRPMMVTRGTSKINTVIAFIGVIGAVMMFGFLGLFVGPFAMLFFAQILALLPENGSENAIQNDGEVASVEESSVTKK